MLDNLTVFFSISIDKIVHPKNEVPTEVVIEDKTTMEQLQLIQKLEENDKTIIFSMLDTILTKKKFKNFFPKNLAMLQKQKNRRIACFFCDYFTSK